MAAAGGSGVFTAEGNKAGPLAAALAGQRERERADFERAKAAAEAAARRPIAIADKFAAPTGLGDVAASLKAKGLVTIDDFRRAREEAAAAGVAVLSAAAAAAATAAAAAAATAAAGSAAAAASDKRKRPVLSFNDDDDDDGGGAPAVVPRAAPPATAAAAAPAAATAAPTTAAAALPGPDGKRFKLTKDPGVETSFLPDAEREAREAALRERLAREWVAEQERIKSEPIEVVYSWWDGSGHRRDVTLPKGTTIGKFLERARQDLAKDFPTLRSTATENLLFVKEDLILPHSVSFYDLVVAHARGKSGPLFNFGVHDDLRLRADARVEKDESHPGKIVDRRWYEKNKHTFPASRWEQFDLAAAATRTAPYTVHGHEVVPPKR